MDVTIYYIQFPLVETQSKLAHRALKTLTFVQQANNIPKTKNFIFIVCILKDTFMTERIYPHSPDNNLQMKSSALQ